MKFFAIFCALIVSIFSTNSDAATARNPRGQSVSDASATTTRSGTTSARSATTTRSAAVPAATTSARSATANRTTVSRTQTTANSTSGTAARSATVTARAGSTQKVINIGTTVAAANENVVVSEACRQKYYGCMDSFCMLDNDSGGRCICSDKNAEYDEILAQIEELDQQSYQMATYGVERIEMGDAADVAIANANSVAQSILDKNKKEEKEEKSLDLNSWLSTVDFSADNIFADTDIMQSPIEGKEGDALYRASHEICIQQMPECASELSMLQLMYAQQIRNDCVAYENSLKQQKNASAQKLYVAEQALRDAALEQYQTANKYDLGQCTVEFKNCMMSTGGCGDDFSGCASVAAFDSTSTRGNKKASNYEIKGNVTSIEIKASTYDILLSKKPLCESVTKQCQLVADQVWDTFLKEVAPQIKSAELIAEDNARQSCVGNISSCFQQACKDTIDPNDPDGSYDLCLTRPETMLNLCQVPLNACGISTASAAKAQESEIWGFVVARLASMRIDSCTTQFKECLQSEDRCGEDYSQCIGLDLEGIRDMCPIETLTACQQVDKDGNNLITSMDQIDSIIQGVYLGIDNALLNQCQKLVNEKMIDLCGDTSNCYAFEDDSVIGTESLLSYKDNDGNYVIDGLISFGNLEVEKTSKESENNADYKYNTYEINIGNYKEHLNEADPTAARVVSSLESVANKIEQKIAILRQDPEIQMCVEGRNMTQIKRGGGTSTARFPYLLDSSIMAIVAGGLDKAKSNYTKKYNELVEEALEDQNDQIKSVLCAAMASSGEPQCVKYNTDKSGEAVCSSYEAPFMEDIFTEDSNQQVGISGTDMYSTKYVISGAKMSDLASIQMNGHSEYTQVDSFGNMIGKVTMSSVYSPSTNTCVITTNTTMCKDMEEVITVSEEVKCGGGGITVLGGNSCTGSGGILNIGGGSRTTTTVQNFQGVACKSFMDPVVYTNSVKM